MDKIKNIRVVHDDGGTYSGIVKVSDLIRDYVKSLNPTEENDAECIEWLNDKGYDVMNKIAFITSVWGIDYELT